MRTLRKALLLSLSLLFSLGSFAQTPKSRHFVFDYNFTVRNTEPGKPLQVWFPIAQSDQFQQVKIVSKSSDLLLQEISLFAELSYFDAEFSCH